MMVSIIGTPLGGSMHHDPTMGIGLGRSVPAMPVFHIHGCVLDAMAREPRKVHPDGMPVIDIPLDRHVGVGKKKPRRSAGASKGSLFDH